MLCLVPRLDGTIGPRDPSALQHLAGSVERSQGGRLSRSLRRLVHGRDGPALRRRADAHVPRRPRLASALPRHARARARAGRRRRARSPGPAERCARRGHHVRHRGLGGRAARQDGSASSFLRRSRYPSDLPGGEAFSRADAREAGRSHAHHDARLSPTSRPDRPSIPGGRSMPCASRMRDSLAVDIAYPLYGTDFGPRGRGRSRTSRRSRRRRSSSAPIEPRPHDGAVPSLRQRSPASRTSSGSTTRSRPSRALAAWTYDALPPTSASSSTVSAPRSPALRAPGREDALNVAPRVVRASRGAIRSRCREMITRARAAMARVGSPAPPARAASTCIRSCSTRPRIARRLRRPSERRRSCSAPASARRDDPEERAQYRLHPDVERLAAAARAGGDRRSLVRVDLLLRERRRRPRFVACEVNADCPGGHNETLALPRIARMAGLPRRTRPDDGRARASPIAWSRSGGRGSPRGAIGFVCATAYAEDLQVCALLERLVRERGGRAVRVPATGPKRARTASALVPRRAARGALSLLSARVHGRAGERGGARARDRARRAHVHLELRARSTRSRSSRWRAPSLPSPRPRAASSPRRSRSDRSTPAALARERADWVVKRDLSRVGDHVIVGALETDEVFRATLDGHRRGRARRRGLDRAALRSARPGRDAVGPALPHARRVPARRRVRRLSRAALAVSHCSHDALVVPVFVASGWRVVRRILGVSVALLAAGCSLRPWTPSVSVAFWAEDVPESRDVALPESATLARAVAGALRHRVVEVEQGHAHLRGRSDSKHGLAEQTEER